MQVGEGSCPPAGRRADQSQLGLRRAAPGVVGAVSRGQGWGPGDDVAADSVPGPHSFNRVSLAWQRAPRAAGRAPGARAGPGAGRGAAPRSGSADWTPGRRLEAGHRLGLALRPPPPDTGAQNKTTKSSLGLSGTFDLSGTVSTLSLNESQKRRGCDCHKWQRVTTRFLEGSAVYGYLTLTLQIVQPLPPPAPLMLAPCFTCKTESE